jgi:copper chaperone CopZ
LFRKYSFYFALHNVVPVLGTPASPSAMPETTFFISALKTQDDADAVMFELQDLPCVSQADVDLAAKTAWVSHTPMIAPEDIAAALAEAGYEAEVQG